MLNRWVLGVFGFRRAALTLHIARLSVSQPKALARRTHRLSLRPTSKHAHFCKCINQQQTMQRAQSTRPSPLPGRQTSAVSLPTAHAGRDARRQDPARRPRQATP